MMRNVFDSRPPSYGGCRCRCHVDSNVKHVAPCCYPPREGEPEVVVSDAPLPIEYSPEDPSDPADPDV